MKKKIYINKIRFLSVHCCTICNLCDSCPFDAVSSLNLPLEEHFTFLSAGDAFFLLTLHEKMQVDIKMKFCSVICGYSTYNGNFIFFNCKYFFEVWRKTLQSPPPPPPAHIHASHKIYWMY